MVKRLDISILLGGVGISAKDGSLVVLRQGLVQPEVTSSSPQPALEPGITTDSDSEDAPYCQERVLIESGPDVEEDLLQAGDGELRLDLGRGRRDLVQGLQDRCPGWNNVVTSNGLVPVSSALWWELVTMSS